MKKLENAEEKSFSEWGQEEKGEEALRKPYPREKFCTVPYPGVEKVKVKVNVGGQSQHKASPR